MGVFSFVLLKVDHVILFDFPLEPSEYLRRVGRTGRAGRRGKVTVLAYGKQVPVARRILRAAEEGCRIDPTIPQCSSSFASISSSPITTTVAA